MAENHTYEASVEWTGNRGEGTFGYRAFSRDHDLVIDGKPVIAGSSDPAFLGDASRHNPEDMLVASLSACHMLWYLHLCSAAGIIVTGYRDNAIGHMAMNKDGSGQFSSVTLRPQVQISAESDAILAARLHADANEKCFIARSVNFPVHHEPEIIVR